MTQRINPVLKWAGGKRQIIEQISQRFPTNYGKYFEPFVGGGAVFMHLQPEKTYLNDVSTELMRVYKAVKCQPSELMEKLSEHERNHQQDPNTYYYQVRSWDRDDDKWNSLNDVDKAARMIYLNKTCFNGLYRVNKKGYFNVPFNQKKTVKTYDEENIQNLSNYLNESHVKLLNTDFEEAIKEAEAGDFIYFDPPYDLLNGNGFESYTEGGFGVEGQKRLAKVVEKLDKKGCYVMVSNHDTPLIRKLYGQYHYDVIDVRRAINSKAAQRKGKEVIIYNYDVSKGDTQ